MVHVMKTSRAGVLALVGVLSAGALTLAVAAPASAVVIDYRAYQQTLPASVIDGGTLTDEEKIATTNGTRAGVLTKPLVPLGTSSYVRGAGGATGSGLVLLDTLLYMSDGLRAEQTYDRNDPKPSWIDQDEWDACATSGGDDWAGDLFDGARDWFASLDGTDCNDVRAGWDLERNPAYTPIGSMTSPSGAYPASFGGVTFGTPFWSGEQLIVNGTPQQRLEGWVLPLSGTYNGATFPQMTAEIVGPNGFVDVASANGAYTGTIAPNWVPRAACPPGANLGCILVDAWLSGTTGLEVSPGVPWNWLNPAHYTYSASIDRMRALGQSTWTPMQEIPYVSRAIGSPGFQSELARQVLLTAVRTEAGNLYQCRTESFVETAPTIPRPCEPDVPDWEIITERTVEVVPETDTGYVPGSNPTRGTQTTTIPDVVRDWQRDFPDCDETLCLLDLELEMVGSCFDHPEKCADWYTDPNKTTRYTCTYGGVVVDLSQCVKYARLFMPNSITSGSAYPAPGSTNPTAAPAPGSTTSTNPAPATAPGSQPANPNQNRQCWPSGWGIFNPFEWVFLPVKCAMEWAFVPRQEVITGGMNTIRTSWGLTSIQQVTNLLEVLVQAMPNDGGCGGIPLHYEMRGSVVDTTLLNSCSGPLAPAAAVTKSILTGAIIFAAVMAATRYIGSIFGFVGYGQVMEMRAAQRAEREGRS